MSALLSKKGISSRRLWLMLALVLSMAAYAAHQIGFWGAPGQRVLAAGTTESAATVAKAKPNQEIRAVSTNGSTLTVELVSGTGAGERCTVSGYNAFSEPTFVAPTDDDLCKVQVSWNVVVADQLQGLGLYESRNWRSFDRTLDSRGRQGNGLATSGQMTAMLSPAGRTAWSETAFSLKVPGQTVVARAVIHVADHADAPINFDIAADSCLAIDGLGASYSDFLASVDPGRWAGFIARNPGSPGANYDVVRRLPGTSYDFEFRTGTLSTGAPGQQLRATWYTYDGNFRPVWLQTEWLDLSPYDGLVRGAQFKGELRRYRWNPSSAGRTGGKRVGKITGVLLKPEYPAYGAGVRIMVNREWSEPGVTDSLPGGKLTDGECLLRHNSFFDYGRNAQVNDAFSGVWSLTGDAPNTEADSVVISAGTETHLLRLWDTAGNPTWLFATNYAPPASIFVSNVATIPVRYARSPYTLGFPINLGPDHYYVPQCKLNACEMCSVTAGTLMRSYNTPIDEFATEPFNKAQLTLNLAMAANQPAPDNPGSQCGTHNNQAPFGMGNPALSWVRRRTEGLINSDWVGVDRSRFELDGDANGSAGRVSVSPQIANKPDYTSESAFTISWAVPELGSNSGASYRLVRRRFVANDFKVVSAQIPASGTFTDGIYQRETALVPEIRPFPPSSYIYEVRQVTAADQVGVVVAKASQVYVRDPRDPPEPPDCFKILEGTLTSTASVGCAPGYGPDLTVESSADLVLLFSSSFSAQYYHVTEEKLVNGELVPANCNTGYPNPLGAGASGQPQPPNYRLPIKACALEGSYYYQIYACDIDFRCSRRAPITPIIVNVRNSIAAPQNVTAVRHVQPDDGGYGFKVNWEHPMTTPPADSTLWFQVRYRRTNTSNYTTFAERITRQQTGIVTPATPGTFAFSVRARLARNNNGAPFSTYSEWSQEATLVLPPQAAVVGEIADDPRGTNYNPAQHDYQSPQAGDAILAGATAGQASVDGGTASYTLPIQLPPGRHGMQPSVSLNYSSRAGNGVAGMGFSVSASSAISRCPQTLATDGQVRAVQFNADDRLCLDGQRLIRVDGSDYGLTGAIYRTELDSYTLVKQLVGPGPAPDNETYFEVLSKSGERMYFGADQSGRNSRNSRVKPVGAPSAATLGGSLSWLLNTRLDRSENNVQYTYATFGSGENLLSSIAYTGSGTNPGNREVVFSYETRPDRSSSYLAGALSEQTMRLLKIETKAPLLESTTGPSTVLVRSYTPTYTVSNYSGRSILSSLKECFPNGQCLPAHQFAFASNRAPEVNKKLTIGGVVTSPNEPGSIYFSNFTEIGDLNGDGSVEFGVYSRAIGQANAVATHFFKSNAITRSFDNAQAASLLAGGNATHLSDTRGDFNRDGIGDLLLVDELGSLKIRFGNASGSLEPVQALALSPLAPAFPEVRVSDLNADGLTDLVLQYPNASTSSMTLMVYLANTTTGYSQLTSRTLNGSGAIPTVTQIADFDGDGALDLMFDDIPVFPSGTPPSSSRILFGSMSSSNYTLDSSPSVFILPMADASENYAASLRQWGDFNGDGLLDLLTLPNSTRNWTLRLGLGKRTNVTTPVVGISVLGNPIDTGSRRGAEQCKATNSALYCIPRMVERLSFSDYDSDGRMDLMAPRAFAARVCLWQHAEGTASIPLDTVKNRYLCPYSILTGEDDIEASFTGQDPNRDPTEPRECQGIQHNLYGYCLRDIYGSQSDSAANDPSSYYMDHVRFEQTSATTFTTSVTSTQSIQNGAGALGDSSEQDAFGDGLADRISLFGYRYRTVNNEEPGCWNSCDSAGRATGLRTLQKPRPIGTPGPDPFPMTMPNGSGTLDTTVVQQGPFNYLSENRGAYAPGYSPTTAGDPIQPDTLIGVSNGNGMNYRWQYATLASNAGRTNGLPLYTVPARDGGTSYADANHFYFSSSMPVVASFFQSNGIGGETETRYGYEEAMYNNKGRGFTGFRKIITEVHAHDLPGDHSQDVRSATIFKQKFPLISQVECTVTQLWEDEQPLTCGTPNPISWTSHDPDGDDSGYQCNGMACNTATLALGTSYRITNVKRQSRTYDLVSRELITETQSPAPNAANTFDDYGNSLLSSSQTIDYVGSNELRTLTVNSASVYENNPAQWWIDKAVRTTSTVTQSYGDKVHPDGPVVPTRSTTTLFGYDTNTRQVNCEATVAGTSTSSCASVSAERRVASSIGAYGNVTGLSTSARGEAELRTVGTNFDASDGYFPNTVIDGFGKSITTRFDPRFGVPTLVEDGNRVTITSLDVMGRPVKLTPPMVGDERQAMPSTTSYERCGPTLSCAPHAVTRVVSSQWGSPQSLSYVDALGRTVRSVAKLMESGSTPSGYVTTGVLTDSQASVTDMSYDARGQILRQYEPGRDGVNLNAFTHFAYDALGRVIPKWQRFSRVDSDPLPPESTPTYRRTDYTHSGLTTSLMVCQVASMAESCSGGTNADGSPSLSMARTFDSAGKLVSTLDAHGGTTRYWFDGTGNPLMITDVMGQSITASYNDFGHRLSVSDPDRGTWNFSYNGFGEVKTQTDARSKQTTLLLDKLGRVTRREWYENSRTSASTSLFVETTAYDNTPGNSQYGTVMNVTRYGGGSPGGSDYEHWRREFSYDALNRATQASTTMQAGASAPITLVTQTKFDRGFGRTKQMVYPASAVDQAPVSIYQAYNHVGVLVKEGFVADYVPTDPEASPAIRRLNGVDGRGLLTSESYGVQANGVVDWHSNHLYDRSGWLLAQCVSQGGYTCATGLPTGNTNQPLDERYRYDVYGNLKKQYHNGQWLAGGAASNSGTGSVTYTYDALHRLTQAVRTGPSTPETVDYAYNEIGGLTKKSDYSTAVNGAYSYNGSNHQVTAVALKTGGNATYLYDANGNVSQRTEAGVSTTLQYDIANLPRRIVKHTTSADFYEAPGGRYLQRMVAGGVTRDTYSLEKTYEREVVGGNISVERYYLTSGSLLTIKSAGRTLNYLHTDRLGSPVTITEKALPADGKLGSAAPTLVEHKGFDAFGKALDGQWGTSNLGMLNLAGAQAMNTGKRNQRGFTGHEHLDEFALIHMNGRAYDFNLGRFYGVDPFIQFPGNSQSLNPYAYLMNNPLAGTDPTGYAEESRLGEWHRKANELADEMRSGVGFITFAVPDGTVKKGKNEQGNNEYKDFRPSASNGATQWQTSTGETRDQSTSEGTSEIDTLNRTRAASTAPAAKVSSAMSTTSDVLASATVCSNDSSNCAGEMAENAAIGTVGGLALKALERIPGAFKWINRFNREVDEKTARDSVLAYERQQVYLENRRIPGCKWISCFVAGTPVMTAEGLKPIEQIQVGELVQARNEFTGETRWQRVEEIIVTHDREVWDYVFVDSLGNEETLGATPIHPFHTPSGAWVEVGQLELGAQVSSLDGRVLRLKSKSIRKVGETTYNFEIAEDHNYFVGTSGFWVHNGGGSCVLCPPINAEHIFHGEINRRSMAVGFHHAASMGSESYARITSMVSPPNAQGVFVANVEVFDRISGVWIAKRSPSSFFPDSWSRTQVMAEIKSAYGNQTVQRGNYFQGTSTSGVEIGGYLDSSGKINTAFPIY